MIHWDLWLQVSKTGVDLPLCLLSPLVCGIFSRMFEGIWKKGGRIRINALTLQHESGIMIELSSVSLVRNASFFSLNHKLF